MRTFPLAAALLALLGTSAASPSVAQSVAAPAGQTGTRDFTAGENALIAEAVAEFENSLDYRSGIITLGDSLAELSLPPQFLYLDPADTRRVLEEAWNNPGSGDTLGMIVPADVSPLDLNAWGAVIGFVADGHVSDQGAGRLDADALLEQMRALTAAENDELAGLGLPIMTIAGWTDPPTYDRTGRTLSWGRQLVFGDADVPTLGYSLRALGRDGVLTLDVVATMDRLEVVRNSIALLGAAIRFNPGHAYADFRSGEDPAADYGLAALVIGAAPVTITDAKAGAAPGAAASFGRTAAARSAGTSEATTRSFGPLLAGGIGFMLLVLGIWLGRWSRGPR